MSRDKFLNVANECLARSSKASVRKIVVFDVSRTGDASRELSTFNYRDDRVGATVKHERRNPHVGEDRPYVNLAVH
jgi:hypothetical protein